MRWEPRSPPRDAARVPSKAARPLPSPGARSGGLGRSSATAAISGSAWSRPREYALLLEHEAADLLMMYPLVSTAAARAGGKSSLPHGSHPVPTPPSARRRAAAWQSQRSLAGSSSPHHQASGMSDGATTEQAWPRDVISRYGPQPVGSASSQSGHRFPAWDRAPPLTWERQASVSPRLTHAGSLANQAP
jgi:hypothetical protein